MLTPLDEPHLRVRSLSVDYCAGSKIPNHHHDWIQLVYCMNGAIRCELKNEVWIVPPRRAIWLPAREWHELTMLGDVNLRTLYMPNQADSGVSSVRAMNVSGLLHEAILRTCRIGALDERVEVEKALWVLVEEEIRTSTSSLNPLPMPTDSRARALALNLLDPPYATPLLSMITDVGLTRRTAERVFAEETGMTPARWFRQAKLSAALRHLLAGETVAAVAEKCGYKSRSAFSKSFVRLHGFSPGNVLNADAEV